MIQNAKVKAQLTTELKILKVKLKLKVGPTTQSNLVETFINTNYKLSS